MFNGTNLTLNSDLALVITQVYIVGQKARESSDTSMSTCGGVGHIPGHSKSTRRKSYFYPEEDEVHVRILGGQGVRTSPKNHKNIGF